MATKRSSFFITVEQLTFVNSALSRNNLGVRKRSQLISCCTELFLAQGADSIVANNLVDLGLFKQDDLKKIIPILFEEDLLMLVDDMVVQMRILDPYVDISRSVIVRSAISFAHNSHNMDSLAHAIK